MCAQKSMHQHYVSLFVYLIVFQGCHLNIRSNTQSCSELYIACFAMNTETEKLQSSTYQVRRLFLGKVFAKKIIPTRHSAP